MGQTGLIERETIEGIINSLKASGYPGLADRKITPRQAGELITQVSQLGVPDSIRINKVALEDIPRRSFVAEATYKTQQNSMQLDVNGSEVIRVVRLSDMSILVGWLSLTTSKINLVVLTKSFNNEWQQGTLKTLSFNNVFHFDMALMSAGVVCVFCTLKESNASQQVMRVDIQNGVIREHGSPIAVRVTMCKYVRVIKVTEVKLVVFSWGYSGGSRLGYTNVFALEMDPYDVNPNGSAQNFVHRESAIANDNAELTYSLDHPGGLVAYAVNNDSFCIARICLNSNVVLERRRLVNNNVTPLGANEGIINGARRISSVVLTPSKAFVCVGTANKVLGFIVNLSDFTRTAPVELVQGIFEEVNVCRLSNTEVVVGAYGSGTSSNNSIMVKFKVNEITNEITKDIEANHPWLGLGVPMFMDAVNLVVVANMYNQQTQSFKLICAPSSFNKGVRVAQVNDKIIGISDVAATEGSNVPIVVPSFFENA